MRLLERLDPTTAEETFLEFRPTLFFGVPTMYVRLNQMDVYLNIAGGLRVGEPAADLAVAAAIVSAAFETPTSPGMVYFGEVGLSGEIRQVAQADARLKEAQKLGFETAIHTSTPEPYLAVEALSTSETVLGASSTITR